MNRRNLFEHSQLLLLSLLLLTFIVAGCSTKEPSPPLEDTIESIEEVEEREIIEEEAPRVERPNRRISEPENPILEKEPLEFSEGDTVTLFFPRELFFSEDLHEESFLGFLEESGGIVTEPAEDSMTFWDNYPRNAGTIDIEVNFLYSDMVEVREIVEFEMQFVLEGIENHLESILSITRESCDAYTYFYLTVILDDFMDDPRVISLLDFTFPFVGQLDYLLRIFHQYDMASLEKVVFYVIDNETDESFEIYNFLLDAPSGLSMRHNIPDEY